MERSDNDLNNVPLGKEGSQEQVNEETSNNSFFGESNINTPKPIPYTITIRHIRIARGLTQAGLGRVCGFTGEYINMMERGKLFPILETRIKVAQALGCDTSALWIPKEEIKNE